MPKDFFAVHKKYTLKRYKRANFPNDVVDTESLKSSRQIQINKFVDRAVPLQIISFFLCLVTPDRTFYNFRALKSTRLRFRTAHDLTVRASINVKYLVRYQERG